MPVPPWGRSGPRAGAKQCSDKLQEHKREIISVEQPRPLLERLIFPTLCLVVAALMIYEQMSGAYRTESRAYVMSLAVPILLLSIIDLVSALRRKESAAGPDQPRPQRPYIRPVTFLVVALVGVAVISALGFPIVFGTLSVTAMLLLGERNPLRLAALPAAIVAMVHFVFVGVLELDLPYGALWNA